MNHFHICLDQKDPDALLSMHTDLAVEYLSELHGIENVDVYLNRMSWSTSQSNEQNAYGLWGDIFCIKWFSKWLNVPIAIWSLTRETKYLHFNSKQTGYCYNILFHDHTPASGHFEPLLSYRSMQRKTQESHLPSKSNYVTQYRNAQFEICSFEQALLQQGLCSFGSIHGDCHDSLFESVSNVTMFSNGQVLRKAIAQTFFNCITSNDIRARKCLHTFLSESTIREKTLVYGWKAYIVHLVEPFILGQIEGDQFAIKWLCELLNIDIFLWNTKLQKVDLRFHATNGSSKVVYLMRQEINRFHSHYQLLLETTSAQTLLLPINSIVEPASTAAIPHCKKHMKPIQKDTTFEEYIVNNFFIEPKKMQKQLHCIAKWLPAYAR